MFPFTCGAVGGVGDFSGTRDNQFHSQIFVGDKIYIYKKKNKLVVEQHH